MKLRGGGGGLKLCCLHNNLKLSKVNKCMLYQRRKTRGHLASTKKEKRQNRQGQKEWRGLAVPCQTMQWVSPYISWMIFTLKETSSSTLSAHQFDLFTKIEKQFSLKTIKLRSVYADHCKHTTGALASIFCHIFSCF